MQSSNILLAYYFDILFHNNIQDIQKTYVGNSILSQNGYSYIQQYDYYMKEEMVIDDGSNPVFEIDIIRRENFLENTLNFETKSIYKTIENEIPVILDIENKNNYLINIFNDIQVLLKKVSNIEDDNAKLVEGNLLEMVTNLKERYFIFFKYHPVFSYIISNLDKSFFKNKDLKYSFYTELYEVAYNLNLINDSEINEADFINAFTESKPQLLENKIKFIANNYVVAYFLESLKPFFNGFTHGAVERSCVFLNKQNKPLKSTDIYASLSRGKTKIQNDINKMDKLILKLKDKHLI